MKYLSSAEVADKWGISQRRVSSLCSQGRIKDAVKTGKTWLIPENTKKPDDARFTYSLDLENDELFVCEPMVSSYLSIDPDLIREARKLFFKEGLSVSDAINTFLYEKIRENNERRIGVAEGKLGFCDDIDFCNAEVEKMFGV